MASIYKKKNNNVWYYCVTYGGKKYQGSTKKLNLININLKKDTDDVKRYVIDYKNSYNNEIFKLKIEMSFRRKFGINETDIINNKRIFKLLFYLISKKRLPKTEQLQGIYMILFLWVIIMLRFLIQNKLILLRTFIKILTIHNK